MGRIDYTVLFEKAKEEYARKIFDCIVEEYRSICIENRVSLEIDSDVYDHVIKRCDLSKFGYRNVKKVFAGTVVKELKIAWRLKDKGLTKIRIYTDKDGDVTHFLYFKKNSLENNELSMYNKIEV